MYILCVRVQIGDTILCLHTSVMTTDLSTGKELPLSLSPGMIIALKSAKLDLTLVPHVDEWVPVIHRMDLDLCNIDNVIILRITFFRGTKKVFFNDCADESLLDGWGKGRECKVVPSGSR